VSGPLTVESVNDLARFLERTAAGNPALVVDFDRLLLREVLLAVAEGHQRSADLAKAALTLTRAR
jgi:hypothetical protein